MPGQLAKEDALIGKVHFNPPTAWEVIDGDIHRFQLAIELRRSANGAIVQTDNSSTNA